MFGKFSSKLKKKMLKLRKEYRSIEKGIDKIENFLDYHQSPVDQDNVHSPYFEDVLFETTTPLEEDSAPSLNKTSPKRTNSQQNLFESENLKDEDTKFKLREILTEIIRIENDFLSVFETMEEWLERKIPDLFDDEEDEPETNKSSACPSTSTACASSKSTSTSTTRIPPAISTSETVRTKHSKTNNNNVITTSSSASALTSKNSFSSTSSSSSLTSTSGAKPSIGRTRRVKMMELFQNHVFQGRSIHKFLNINNHIDKVINFWDIFQDVFNIVQDLNDFEMSNMDDHPKMGLKQQKGSKNKISEHFCCDWEELSKSCSSHVSSFENVIQDFNCLIKS